MLLWIGQGVTLAVAVVTGWFALRTKRTDVDEARRARFDARVDKDLEDALAANMILRHEVAKEVRVRLRYEAALIRAGIDPDEVLRGSGDARTD